LCSMLGNDCELSMGVVRDVLCKYWPFLVCSPRVFFF
jgi:hypothetical protein